MTQLKNKARSSHRKFTAKRRNPNKNYHISAQIYSSKTKCLPYERALCAHERAHMLAACLLQTRALSSSMQVC